MWLIFILIAAASAAKSVCKEIKSAQFSAAPADIVISEVYTSDLSCDRVTNTQIRARWSADEYDLTGFDCDHIVDTLNVDGLADNCGREIAANKIPALAGWNRAVGQLCWRDAEREKRRVYGDAIVDTALTAVRKCCGGMPMPQGPPFTPSTSKLSADQIVYVVCAIAATVIIVSIICALIYKKHQDNLAAARATLVQ